MLSPQLRTLRASPRVPGPRPPGAVGRLRPTSQVLEEMLSLEAFPPLSKTASPSSPLLNLAVFPYPQVEEFEHYVAEDLGPLQFVKLRKRHSLVDDAWFCDRITVQGPGASAEATFPCYRWVQGEGVLSLPEGTGERRPEGSGCRALGLLGRGEGRQ